MAEKREMSLNYKRGDKRLGDLSSQNWLSGRGLKNWKPLAYAKVRVVDNLLEGKRLNGELSRSFSFANIMSRHSFERWRYSSPSGGSFKTSTTAAPTNRDPLHVLRTLNQNKKSMVQREWNLENQPDSPE
jgi:hypothetical protein